MAYHLSPGLCLCLSSFLSFLSFTGLAAGFSHHHVAWMPTCCPENLSARMHVLDAVVSQPLQKVLLHLHWPDDIQWTWGILDHKRNCSNNGRSLYGWGHALSFFTMYMQDRTTGYSSLLPQLSLVQSEYHWYVTKSVTSAVPAGVLAEWCCCLWRLWW